MQGQYLHATMHVIGDDWKGVTREQLNISLNAMVLGMMLASQAPDTAQKLLDDAENTAPGVAAELTPVLDAIVGGVEHPETYDCLASEPQRNSLDRLLDFLHHAPPR